MSADLIGFICGGYFLSKRIPRPRDISDPVPGSVITVSECLTDIAPDTWVDKTYSHNDKERAAKALKFGIPAAAVRKLVKLFSRETGWFPPNAFPNFSVAQEFYRHCAQRSDVLLLGIGLEASLLPSLYAQRNDDVNRGYGLTDRIRQHQSLAPRGTVLGYEPLGFESAKFHSWLCHNAPAEALDRFGIRPNERGFIESLAEAVRVTQHVKSAGATTAIWAPWLVVQYDVGQRFH